MVLSLPMEVSVTLQLGEHQFLRFPANTASRCVSQRIFGEVERMKYMRIRPGSSCPSLTIPI